MPMIRLLFTAAIVYLATGCSDGPRLAPVRGTVTLDGKPLDHGMVTFETPGHRSAVACIVNGEILGATTFKLNDGVPVGTPKIAVTSISQVDMSRKPGTTPEEIFKNQDIYMGGKSLIPAMYNDPATSGLTAEVPAGGATIELRLVSSPGK
jgi:hypothetical protein